MRTRLAGASSVAVLISCAHAQFAEPIGGEFRPPPIAAEFFPATDVRLLDAPAPHVSPFKVARDAHAKYLLELEADRLLARFRSEAGLTPKAEGYGGWERDTIGGHSLGHYLSACSKMYAGTGDSRFKERVAYIVGELTLCQQKHTEQGLPGYVAAIPNGKRAFAEIAKGDIRSKGFDLNGIWVPWYTLHKEMAGLRDAYLFCGNSGALDVWKGLAEFANSIVGHLDETQLNLMLRCEHGGMNEVAADLFAITHDPSHLDLARRFNDRQVLDPLAMSRDILPGLHANTQIPKVIGAARQFELTGEASLAAAAKFFWTTVTSSHSYATGGNSMNEYFGPAGVIAARLEGNTTETCNTYNMLKLSRHLFEWTADPRVIDYYERATYNHILASHDPATAGVCYFLQLRPAAEKPFQRPFEDFTCCVGSGMENHASYGDAIYARGVGSEPALFVNMFIASEVSWGEQGISLRQDTAFPAVDDTTFTIAVKKPVTFTLALRIPGWVCATPGIRINGEAWAGSQVRPGTFAPIRREWRAGDRVDVRLPMSVRAEPTPDDPDRLAFLYGPVLLAGDLGSREPDAAGMPHLVTDTIDPSGMLSIVERNELRFRSSGTVLPNDLDLLPLYAIRHQRYVAYWKRLTPAGWAGRRREIETAEAARRALADRTVDYFQPGEMQPERDHAFDGVFTNAGEHKGVRWRDAGPRGWIAFTMKVPQGPATLVCTYWGSDAGDREFDILVGDTPIGTQRLEVNQPDRFFDVEYPIPEALTAGRTEVRVKLVGKAGKMTGGLFGARIVRPRP